MNHPQIGMLEDGSLKLGAIEVTADQAAKTVQPIDRHLGTARFELHEVTRFDLI